MCCIKSHSSVAKIKIPTLVFWSGIDINCLFTEAENPYSLRTLLHEVCRTLWCYCVSYFRQKLLYQRKPYYLLIRIYDNFGVTGYCRILYGFSSYKQHSRLFPLLFPRICTLRRPVQGSEIARSLFKTVQSNTHKNQQYGTYWHNYLFKMSHKEMSWSLAHLLPNILVIFADRGVKYEHGAFLEWYLQGKPRITRRKTCTSATLSTRIYTWTNLKSKYFWN